MVLNILMFIYLFSSIRKGQRYTYDISLKTLTLSFVGINLHFIRLLICGWSWYYYSDDYQHPTFKSLRMVVSLFDISAIPEICLALSVIYFKPLFDMF